MFKIKKRPSEVGRFSLRAAFKLHRVRIQIPLFFEKLHHYKHNEMLPFHKLTAPYEHPGPIYPTVMRIPFFQFVNYCKPRGHELRLGRKNKKKSHNLHTRIVFRIVHIVAHQIGNYGEDVQKLLDEVISSLAQRWYE